MRVLHKDVRDAHGLAALEFALFAPFLAVLIYGLIEITLRFRAADEFQRYLQQAGDYLSREDALVSGDIDDIYAAAEQMMPYSYADNRLDIAVSSIGYTTTGDPELLWRRFRGVDLTAVDLSNANGLGEPGESVIRIAARFSYETPVSQLIGAGQMQLQNHMYFRPRVTRLIAIDGSIYDAGAAWENDGDSTAGESNGPDAVGDVEP